MTPRDRGWAQVLLRVTKQRRAREWLTQLVAMHMSLHSMEVVNRLTSATQLPPGFLQPYISNCIASCQQAAVRRCSFRSLALFTQFC